MFTAKKICKSSRALVRTTAPKPDLLSRNALVLSEKSIGEIIADQKTIRDISCNRYLCFKNIDIDDEENFKKIISHKFGILLIDCEFTHDNYFINEILDDTNIITLEIKNNTKDFVTILDMKRLFHSDCNKLILKNCTLIIEKKIKYENEFRISAHENTITIMR